MPGNKKIIGNVDVQGELTVNGQPISADVSMDTVNVREIVLTAVDSENSVDYELHFMFDMEKEEEFLTVANIQMSSSLTSIDELPTLWDSVKSSITLSNLNDIGQVLANYSKYSYQIGIVHQNGLTVTMVNNPLITTFNIENASRLKYIDSADDSQAVSNARACDVFGNGNLSLWQSATMVVKPANVSPSADEKEIKLQVHYSDFTVTQTGALQITNSDMITQLNEVIDDALDGKQIYACFKANVTSSQVVTIASPLLVSTDTIDINFMSNFGDPTNDETLRMSAKTIMFAKVLDNIIFAPINGSTWAQTLLTAMASDPTKYIELSFKIGNGASTQPTTGGSGKLYEYKFSLDLYDHNGDTVNYLDNIYYANAKYVVCISESNFDRVKAKINPILEEAQYPISLNTPQDLVTLINGINRTVAWLDASAGDTYLLNPEYYMLSVLFSAADKVTFQSTPSGQVDLYADLIVGTTSITFAEGDVATELKVRNIPFGEEDNGDWYYLGLNTNNSCTLTEYGTSGGGTVEAEKIVSIKMTNLDLRDLDSYNAKIGDVQFYCTKDTWDNFVALASSAFSVDITYSNFDTIFKQFNMSGQALAIGYLFMDYLSNNILPPAYCNVPDIGSGASQYFLTDTMTDVVNAVTIVVSALYGHDGHVIYPNMDRQDEPFVTQDTVITVEEIAGASIGASGGSGTGTALYKHSMAVTVYDTGNTMQGVVSFLSKYAEPFVTNDALSDMLAYYAGLQDEHAIINPELIMQINQNTYNFMISNLVPDSVGISIPMTNIGVVVPFILRFNDNTNITDTVTPYIEGGGSSGGSQPSASVLELYYYNVVVKDSNNDTICQLEKTFMAKDMSEVYQVLNNNAQQLATQMGITVATINSDATASSSLSTILATMQLAGVTSQIPFLLESFLTRYNDTIDTKVYYLTDVYPCWGVGDYVVYMLTNQAQFQAFTTLSGLTGANSLVFTSGKVIN